MGSAVDWPLEVIVRAPSMLCSSLVRASFITQPPAGCVRTQAPASPPPAGCVRAIPNVEAHKQRRSARLQPAKSESPAPDSLSSRGHFFDDVASFSRLRDEGWTVRTDRSGTDGPWAKGEAEACRLRGLLGLGVVLGSAPAMHRLGRWRRGPAGARSVDHVTLALAHAVVTEQGRRGRVDG